MLKNLAVVVALCCSLTANAQENSPPISLSANIGWFGLVTSDAQWLGSYMFVGPSVTVPFHEHFNLITGVSFEAAPQIGNWGFVATIIADVPIASWLALDAALNFVHDEDPALELERGSSTTGYVSVAVGPTFVLPNGCTISAMAQLNYSLEGLGYTLSPLVSIGVPVPF